MIQYPLVDLSGPINFPAPSLEKPDITNKTFLNSPDEYAHTGLIDHYSIQQLLHLQLFHYIDLLNNHKVLLDLNLAQYLHKTYHIDFLLLMYSQYLEFDHLQHLVNHKVLNALYHYILEFVAQRRTIYQ
jgi:hypothetical protein